MMGWRTQDSCGGGSQRRDGEEVDQFRGKTVAAKSLAYSVELDIILLVLCPAPLGT